MSVEYLRGTCINLRTADNLRALRSPETIKEVTTDVST